MSRHETFCNEHSPGCAILNMTTLFDAFLTSAPFIHWARHRHEGWDSLVSAVELDSGWSPIETTVCTAVYEKLDRKWES
jgi:hypothetical protein